MNNPIDKVQPWTIKAISTEARNLAIGMARQANMTTGQWLEQMIQRAANGGGGGETGTALVAYAPGPGAVAVQAPANGFSLQELAETMRAARDLSEACGIPVPRGAGRKAMTILNRRLDAAKREAVT